MLKVVLILTMFIVSKTIPCIESVFQDQSKNFYTSEWSMSVVQATSNTTASKYSFGIASMTAAYVHYERLIYSLEQSNFIPLDRKPVLFFSLYLYSCFHFLYIRNIYWY